MCTDVGGGAHKQDLLLSCDGLEDLQFGFYVFTDTKVHQSVKPAKERESRSQHRNGEWRLPRTDLPGLSSAGSKRSGRFVAPMTNTSSNRCSPSSSDSSCETTLREKHWTQPRVHSGTVVVLPVHDAPRVPTLASVGGNGVQFIKEDHTRSSTASPGKHYTRQKRLLMAHLL